MQQRDDEDVSDTRQALWRVHDRERGRTDENRDGEASSRGEREPDEDAAVGNLLGERGTRRQADPRSTLGAAARQDAAYPKLLPLRRWSGSPRAS